MSITIVSHQPQYFPHLELFNKILQSNKFVILDDVKFNNSAWHAKTIIKDNKDNIIQLIIPCSKINSSSNKIKDIKIFNDKWKKKHLKTLEQIFGKTKYFNEIYKVIFQILSLFQYLSNCESVLSTVHRIFYYLIDQFRL